MTGSSTATLLIIEDCDEDFESLNRVLSKTSVTNPVFRCVDGDEALDFLCHTGEYANPQSAPRPSVILLDLNLPGTDGLEVLEQIKQDENLSDIPVVVLTSSSNSRDIDFCYQRGASSYVLKSMDTNKFISTLQAFITYWLENVVFPNHVERLSP